MARVRGGLALAASSFAHTHHHLPSQFRYAAVLAFVTLESLGAPFPGGPVVITAVLSDRPAARLAPLEGFETMRAPLSRSRPRCSWPGRLPVADGALVRGVGFLSELLLGLTHALVRGPGAGGLAFADRSDRGILTDDAFQRVKRQRKLSQQATPSPEDDVAELEGLRDRGLLTEEEFKRVKEKALA
jgi:putative oligomerization/nucleic acid binding protein